MKTQHGDEARHSSLVGVSPHPLPFFHWWYATHLESWLPLPLDGRHILRIYSDEELAILIRVR